MLPASTVRRRARLGQQQIARLFSLKRRLLRGRRPFGLKTCLRKRYNFWDRCRKRRFRLANDRIREPRLRMQPRGKCVNGGQVPSCWPAGSDSYVPLFLESASLTGRCMRRTIGVCRLRAIATGNKYCHRFWLWCGHASGR